MVFEVSAIPQLGKSPQYKVYSLSPTSILKQRFNYLMVFFPGYEGAYGGYYGAPYQGAGYSGYTGYGYAGAAPYAGGYGYNNVAYGYKDVPAKHVPAAYE